VTTMNEVPQLLAPREVAALFRVDPKTVTRWAEQGRLTAIRTLGGHRRFRADEVYALLRATMTGPGQAQDLSQGLAQGPGQDHGSAHRKDQHEL
jgi:excisionase family DNA binding protein